ncbi:MAG TPA: transposase [Gammaproteobacteria bacterium]|nr:transposase [Gammaproteobacteria bacterium]
MQSTRAAVSGGTYFFTVHLAERGHTHLVDHVTELREVIRKVQRRRPFHIDAMVVLPDHLHAVWTMPPRDADHATRWMLIKAGFSRTVSAGGRTRRSQSSGRETSLWRRRYREHPIRDPHDYGHHVAYIHHNPVKHGYVPSAVDWPYSSFHRYVAAGILPADWDGRPLHEDGVGQGRRW